MSPDQQLFKDKFPFPGAQAIMTLCVHANQVFLDVLFRNWWPERRRRGERILIPSCSEASGKDPRPTHQQLAFSKFSAPLAISALILEELGLVFT